MRTLSLNVNKSKYMIFKTTRRNNMINPLNIKIDNTYINRVDELNFLGISFNEQLNWQSHINNISNRCSRAIGILNKLKRLLPLNIKIMLYNTLILSHLNYGLTAWGYRCDRIKTLILSHLNYGLTAWGYRCDRIKTSKESRPNYMFKQI